MWDYIEPLIDERTTNPGEDLISRIARAELNGRKMTTLEIKGFVALLLAAGGDTTDKAIANMWYHMLYTRPDQFSAVRKEPELTSLRSSHCERLLGSRFPWSDFKMFPTGRNVSADGWDSACLLLSRRGCTIGWR